MKQMNYKVGDKVRCIKNTNIEKGHGLTLNKIYYILKLGYSGRYLYVVDDSGLSYGYKAERFTKFKLNIG